MNNELLTTADDLPELDVSAATFECMEVLEELTTLENNLFVYEAVKHVKKAKSDKKKIKTKTTVMKAKDAKAKKAGGKVIKITKEGDTDGQMADGGTGPIPTTSDTNGLTDTDLDADPEANVQVTEISDDEPAGTTAPDTASEACELRMEGGDMFLVVYEDESIIALEDGIKDMEGSFIDKVIEIIKRIGDWISSFVAKAVSFFRNEGSFFKDSNNKKNMETNIANQSFELGKEIPVFENNPKAIIETIFTDLDNSINNIKSDGNTNITDYKLYGVEMTGEGGGSAGLWKKVSSDGKKTKKPYDAKITLADIQYIVNGEFATRFQKVRSSWRHVENKFKAAKDLPKETAMETKKKISACHKGINASFGVVMKIARVVNGVMHGCAGKPKETKPAA